MRLLPTSLFGRMFALSLLATLAALAVAGIAISGVLERFVTGGIDARLSDRLIALESAIRADGSLDRAQLARVATRIAPDEPWRVVVGHDSVASGGEIELARHRPLRGPPHPPPPPPPDGSLPKRPVVDDGTAPFEGRLRGGPALHGLTATIGTAAGDAHVIVAVSRDEIDRPVIAALAPLAGSLAILGIALGGASVLQLRWGLRPLSRLRLAVEDIRQGRASRVPEDVPQELAPLARELNALAADNAAALKGARASAANLAHALKTPISTLSLHLADDPAAQAQLSRIDATLRHHLGRARAVATDRRVSTAIPLALADLSATIAALHEHRIPIHVETSGELYAAIDPQDLDELAGNLIDNAARHAASRVTVTAAVAGRHVLLSVSDDGAGIPEADRARVTAPGTRLDERDGGHGFGLSIARELAELYGGALTLDEGSDGGLKAAVTLPLTAPLSAGAP